MPGEPDRSRRRRDFCGFGTSFESKRWFSLNLGGLVGVSMSWSVHLFALITVYMKLLENSPMSSFLYWVLYVPVASLAMVSLFKAWTSDPGAVPLGARPLTIVRRATSMNSTNSNSSNVSNRESNPEAQGNGSSDHSSSPLTMTPPPVPSRAVRRCHKCLDNYKPPRAHHDSVTGRCIVKFDHFCPCK